MLRKRVFLSDSLTVLRDAFVSAVTTLKATDPLHPITIVVPTNELGAHLSDVVASSNQGHLGLNFVEISELARSYASESLGRRGMPLVSPAVATLVLNKIVDERGITEFPNPNKMLRLGRLFFETITDLKEAEIGPIDLRKFHAQISSDDLLYREKIRCLEYAYEHYEAWLSAHGLLDHSDLFVEANRKCRTSELEGTLVLYCCAESRAVCRRFLTSLFAQTNTLAFLPWQEGTIQESFSGFLTWLKNLGFVASKLVWPDLKPSRITLGAGLVTSFSRGEKSPDTQKESNDIGPIEECVTITVAPDQRAESRGMAENILTLVRDKGYRFDEIIVLAPDDEGYRGGIIDGLRQLGIPCDPLPGTTPSVSTSTGVFRAVCKLIAEDCPLRSFFGFLRCMPRSIEALLGRTVEEKQLVQWEEICVEAGIDSEDRGWSSRLASLEEQYDARRSDSDMEKAREIRLLQKVLAPLLEDVKRLRRKQDWESWCVLLRSFFNRNTSSGRDASISRKGEFLSDAPRDEDEYLLDKMLAEFSSVLPLLDESRPAEWARVLHTIAADIPAVADFARGEGVQISSLAGAYGLTFRATICAGLADVGRSVNTSTDPILSIKEREHLSEVLTKHLPTGTQFLESQRLLFVCAIQNTTERLYVSSPERINGASTSISALVHELTEKLEGGHVTVKKTNMVDVRYSALSQRDVLSPQEHTGPEEEVTWLGQGLEPVASPDTSLYSLSPFFRPAANAVLQRQRVPLLTEFDGCFEEGTSVNILQEHLFPDGLYVSASALHSYARCPFRYFLTTVLKLDPLDDPTKRKGIEPKDRGSLLHKILEEFFLTWKRDSYPGETLGVLSDKLLNEIADEQFRLWTRTRPNIAPAWKNFEREQIMRQLQAFLRRETNRLTGFVAEAFEEPFGFLPSGEETHEPRFFPPGTVPFSLTSGKSVKLRGRVDRIDVRREGGAGRIIDYKTGQPAASGYGGGTALQLGLYLYAASFLRPDLIWKSAEYETIDGGGYPKSKSLTIQEFEQTSGTLREIVTNLVAGMSNGLFFPAPGSCAACPLLEVCGAYAEEGLAGKMNDPRVDEWRWVRSQV